MSLKIRINLDTLLKIHSCCSVAQLCPTICDPMDCSMPGFSVLHYLQEHAQIHGRWVTDAIQQSHPLLSPSPPALIFPSNRVFSNESTLHISWQSIGASTSASVLPMNIQVWVCRIHWVDLLALQGTLKSLLRPDSSKVSILAIQPSLFSKSHMHT